MKLVLLLLTALLSAPVLAQQTPGGIAFPVAPVAQPEPGKDAGKQSQSDPPRRAREELLSIPSQGARSSASANPPIGSLTERPAPPTPQVQANRDVTVLKPSGDPASRPASTSYPMSSGSTKPLSASKDSSSRAEQGGVRPPESLPTVTPSTMTTPKSSAASFPIPNALDLPNVSVIAARPGMTEFIPIAKGALNRIVTSFPAVRARHSIPQDAAASIEAHGAVVYVGTLDPEPIAAFLVDSEDESRAISVVFVPKDIPPRDVTLQYSATNHASQNVSAPAKEARQWEESQPYVDMIKGMLRTLALGHVPPGYSIGTVDTASALPRCAAPGMRMTLGQVIEGARFTIAVYRAENTSHEMVELNEAACYRPGVVATAAWPSPLLMPNEAAEVFVVHIKDTAAPAGPARTARPSLLARGTE